MEESIPQKLFKNRRQWRSWLEKNHDRSAGIWMVYYKKHTGKESVSYEDAVEEALCFGWVDSLVRRLDEERYLQKFTPRKARSTWSKSNKERVARLIGQGCMTDAGLASIEAAKKNGSWDLLTDVDNMLIPDDLSAALAADPQALANFNAFSPSERKMYIYWVSMAKRDETRRKRIAETVSRSARNLRRTER